VGAGIALVLLIRPANLDPGSNVGSTGSPFVDLNALLRDVQDLDAPVVITPEVSRIMTREESSSIEESPTEDDPPQTIEEQDPDAPFFITPQVSIPIEKDAGRTEPLRDATPRLESKKTKALTKLPTSISSYDPKQKPLIDLKGHKPSTTAVDVHLIIDATVEQSSGAQSKFLLDGLERSPLTNVVGMTFLNPNMHQVSIGRRTLKPLVYLVDWGSMLRDCHRLYRVLDQLQRKPEDYVLLADFSGSTRQSRCDHLFPDDPNLRLVKRSIVKGRHYDRAAKVIREGKIVPNSGSGSPGGLVKTAALVVRERFVAAMLNITKDRSPLQSTRNIDVCCFWKQGDNSHYGFWRRDVSNFLEKLGNSSNYSTLIDVVVNDQVGMDAGNIQLKYVKALLNCKITVVAQRDEWTDHYRLYESMASGALVLTDRMRTPPRGLKNKTNVLVYDSLESLADLIHFYLDHDKKRLSLARRGMELALGRFRSWHRVEELLFGSPISQVDKPYSEAPRKMIRPQISLIDGDVIVPT
jgi:hypothetical protein